MERIQQNNNIKKATIHSLAVFFQLKKNFMLFWVDAYENNLRATLGVASVIILVLRSTNPEMES